MRNGNERVDKKSANDKENAKPLVREDNVGVEENGEENGKEFAGGRNDAEAQRGEAHDGQEDKNLSACGGEAVQENVGERRGVALHKRNGHGQFVVVHNDYERELEVRRKRKRERERRGKRNKMIERERRGKETT